MRLFFSALALLGLAHAAFAPAVSAEAGGEAPLPQKGSIEALLDEARDNNPQIQAARAQWQAAREKGAQVGWLEDPVVSYTYFGEEVQTRVGPQEQAFGISQKLPFPGKLSDRSQVAAEEAKALGQLYRATEQEILAQVKQTYYELFWIRNAIEITEQDKTLLEHLEQVARSHFAAHGGRSQDVSKAQVEISRAIDRLLSLKQQAATVQAQLNALLDRPENAPMDSPSIFALPALAFSLEELQQMARDHRQEVLAGQHRLRRDETQVRLAKRRRFPDLTAGFNYMDIGGGSTSSADDGTDAWNVTFKFNLPIWEKRLRANVDEAKAQAASSEAQVRQLENAAEFEVADAYVRWETARNLVSLYKTAVIPQAEQVLDAAEAAYQAGESDFLNLLEGERVWLNAQLTYWRAYTDTAQQFAALERAVGMDLNAQGGNDESAS